MFQSPVFDPMISYSFSYANQQDAKIIFSLFYSAFKGKFQSMLPESPQKAFILYYNYFFKGIQRKKDKIILIKNKTNETLGFLALEGLGVPFFSGNPSLTIIGQTISQIGIKKFLRLFIGMLLIEGYPPSTEYLYINTIIINRKYRSKGLGRKLIRLAEIIAERRNFKGLCLYVDIDNKKAIKFYEKLNFKNDSGFGGDFVNKIIGVKYYLYEYKLLNKNVNS